MTKTEAEWARPTWRGLFTFQDICEFADFIDIEGPTDGWIVIGVDPVRRERWTTGKAMHKGKERLFIWPWVRGGRCYMVDELVHDQATRESVKRTAALLRRRTNPKEKP